MYQQNVVFGSHFLRLYVSQMDVQDLAEYLVATGYWVVLERNDGLILLSRGTMPFQLFDDAELVVTNNQAVVGGFGFDQLLGEQETALVHMELKFRGANGMRQVGP